MTPDCEEISGCRACISSVAPVLDLGLSPLANRLVQTPDECVPQYPLALVACEGCGLVQQAISLRTQDLFGADYPYLSSVSAAVRANADDLAQKVRAQRPHARLALDVGSNDGTTQLAMQAAGIPCIGVDPAQQAVALARSRGCRAYCGPFDADSCNEILTQSGPVDVVTMSNVLAHVPDPAALLAAARMMLQPDGLLVVEVQSWADLVELGAFDMVYHEHHAHFSLGALLPLLARNGFGARRFDRISAQGGSLRLWCEPGKDHAPDLLSAAQTEEAIIADAPLTLQQKLRAARHSARAFVQRMRGRQVAGFGAAAKTVTILAALDGDLGVRVIADNAPSKIGRYLPGTGIPIVSAADMVAERPDVIVLFAWNLAAEILPELQGIEVWSPMPTFRRLQ